MSAPSVPTLRQWRTNLTRNLNRRQKRSLVRPMRARGTKGRGVNQSTYKNFEIPARTIFKSLAGIHPLTKFVQLKYADHRTISTSSGFPTPQQYCLNGMYDPDITNITDQRQPYLYDMFLGASAAVPMYGKYLVHHADVKCTFYNTNSGSTSVGRFYIQIHDSTITPNTNNYEAGMLQTGVKSKLTNVLTSGRASVTLKSSCTIKDTLEGDMEDADAAYNANPSKLVYLTIWFIPLDEAATATYYIDTKITYYAELFQRNAIAMS